MPSFNTNQQSGSNRSPGRAFLVQFVAIFTAKLARKKTDQTANHALFYVVIIK